jgi:predicted signal transduction protein with EAL and GGDEF domain
VLFCDLDHVKVVIAKRADHPMIRAFHRDEHEGIVGVSIGISSRPATPRRALIRKRPSATPMPPRTGLKRGAAAATSSSNPVSGVQAADRFGLEKALRRPVVQHELQVYYRPIMNLGAGRDRRALVLWGHDSVKLGGRSQSTRPRVRSADGCACVRQ